MNRKTDKKDLSVVLSLSLSQDIFFNYYVLKSVTDTGFCSFRRRN